MNFIEKHKALLITSLITGTIIFALFSFSLKKKSEFIAESYFEIEPQTQEELEQLERLKAIEDLEKATPKTNQAFNEDEEFKEMMRNFKTATANQEDFSKTQDEPTEDTSENPEDVITSNGAYNASKTYALKDDDRKTYSKAKDILAMHSTKKETNVDKSNTQSSVSFSLSNRTKVNLPPPVYLCEENGKIVVNITVNADGMVTDAYINSSSTTKNQCLIDHALEYAKNATFSSADRKSQIGSITYYFQGKH